MPRLTRALVETLLAAAATAGAQVVPTVPGDCNADWAVDGADLAVFAACMNGPGVEPPAGCTCADLDGGGDVSVPDFAVLQTVVTGTQLLSVDTPSDADDGTEVNDLWWQPDGYEGGGSNRIGAAGDEFYDIGLRFRVDQLQQGEHLAYARLVLPGTGAGQVTSQVSLRVVGVDQDSPAPFYVRRPSRLPKTTNAVGWDVAVNWPEPRIDLTCVPLRRYSPDVASIVNEILARPNWGCGTYGKTLALVVQNHGSAGANFVCCDDYRNPGPACSNAIVRPSLELYRTMRATFIGKELLGCPTERSVVLSAMSLMSVDAYAEYGTAADVGMKQTPPAVWPGGVPLAIVLDGLEPDTRYFYRLRYRRPSSRDYNAGPLRSFHTARPPGSPGAPGFSFTVVADSHPQDAASPALYRQTLQNALADGPDFHVDLGDTFQAESYDGRDALDFDECVQRDLDQRPFLDLLCHSAPFFLVLGNHEAEQGWRLDGSPDNLAVWATLGRTLLYPLPSPDDFYGGNPYPADFVGLREDYYAWQWGDALFVVLDPFWYTTTKPHDHGGTPGSGDNWDWTLGWEQYDWLRSTLEHSPATFKFVFAHHVTGGVNTYGRGGIEAARYALGGYGSFEWGGEEATGEYAFDARRPGWGRPIHQLLADNHVTIFFHGHDHVFVKQELDGVIYQECPQPADPTYGAGFYDIGHYTSGDAVNNSGHLRVTVSPEQVLVQYVRAYLPGDGPNGAVAYTYAVQPPTSRP
jgi:hypothetical protein